MPEDANASSNTNDELRIRFLGVGDGDSILLELPDGTFGLVDSSRRLSKGPPAALEHLRGETLTFCCLTHPHADHFSGLLEILQQEDIAARQFWYAMSDLDDVVPLWNVQTAGPVSSADTQVAQRRRHRMYGELIELFTWLRKVKRIELKLIAGVEPRTIAGVDFLAFGPQSRDWNRYVELLNSRRAEDQPLIRDYANRISISILVRFGEHLIWLLGDTTRTSLVTLSEREQQIVKAAQAGVRASVLKVPHHGAADGWFDEMPNVLMRCEPDDVVVFSASGSQIHPNARVRSDWEASGKRIADTWSETEIQPSSALGGKWRRTLDLIAKPVRRHQPRDVLVTIPKSGAVEFQILESNE